MKMSEKYWRRMLAQGGKLYWANVKAIRNILIENRGYVVEIPEDEYVILLCSGGMDSVILIDLIIRKWNCNVILIYGRVLHFVFNARQICTISKRYSSGKIVSLWRCLVCFT